MIDKAALLEEGWQYQDFCAINLQRVGLVLNNLQSKHFQQQHGENLLGMEIKLDRNYSRTGNLFVEIAEKTCTGVWVHSGIYAPDRSWLYAIGDYSRLFVFVKNALRDEWQRREGDYIENGTHSARGFLLGDERISALAVRSYRFKP